MSFDGGNRKRLGQKGKAGPPVINRRLAALPDEHFGLARIMGLLSHWRHRPAFAPRSPVRRPRLTVKLKPVAGMQAATRGQEVEASIHEGEAGFFENAPGGNVLDARVGEIGSPG